MKIGIDARLWNETGVGRYIRNLVWQLQEIDKKNEYVLFVKKGINKQELKIEKQNWKIIETDTHWHSLEEQIKFPKILYNEKLDLVHFPYFSMPIAYDKPFVVTIHDLIINHFPTGKASTLPYPLYLLKRIGYSAVVSHAIKNSKKVIVPLNSVKEDVIKTYKVLDTKVAVTYEGNSRLKTSLTKTFDSKQKYFLYVGNAYPHKNLEFLIDSFTSFKKETKTNINLVLVGKDDYFYNKLRQKVESEGLKDISFKHNISDDELFSLYSNAVALISPSKMEGFGLTPLEAINSSCLVLLSDIPSFKEVCKDAAIYFDPNSTNSLKEKMNLVYNLNHEEKQKYIKKGLERVKNFSWRKMAEETLKIYESCLSASSR